MELKKRIANIIYRADYCPWTEEDIPLEDCSNDCEKCAEDLVNRCIAESMKQALEIIDKQGK